MTISLLAIPVFFETTTKPTQLFRQWLRMFYYGHRGHPAMAILTLALYAISAWRRYTESRSWKSLVLAGVVTVCMTPFTWVVMMPTNTRIYGLATGEAEMEMETELETGTGTGEEEEKVDIQQAKRLVRKWGVLHLIRSFFPLAAAGIGMGHILGEE